MFHIISIDSQEPVRDATGQIITCETGRTAADIARAMSESSGKRYQPRPIKSDAWKQREQARFDSGHYVRVPWHDSTPQHAWFLHSIGVTDHFVHVSLRYPGKIAFTESATKGAADIQTRMKPGKYLERYYSNVLTSKQIQSLAQSFSAKFETNNFRLTESRDDIARVYRDGPDSCMSNNAYRCRQGWGVFQTPFHPCEIYAAGDLAIAYLESKGRITARSLVWPEKKTYGRIYGDRVRLEPLLIAAGYKQNPPIGARLIKEKVEGGFVCPYIDNGVRSGDGALYVTPDDTGDYLIITEDDGPCRCDSLSGLTPNARYRDDYFDDGTYSDDEDSYCCSHCGDTCDENDSVYITDMDESWCSGCAEDAYVCAHTGNRYARQRNVVLMANGDYWNVDYFEDFGFTCEGTDENYHIDDSVNLENGTTWCESYFADNGFVCSHCEGRFHNYEMSDQQEMSCVSCEDSEGHIAQAGRDESPTQLEIPLPWEYRLGDVVTMKHTASYCAGMTGIVVTIEQSVNSAMPIQICCNTMQTMWVFACDILSISRPQS